jgi:phage terminase large subunit-like protein
MSIIPGEKSPKTPRKRQAVGKAARIGYTAVALNYAQRVVDGTSLAGKWVRLACQRHLDDLARTEANDKEWPYLFSESRANKACKFIELLPHTKGEWARKVGGVFPRIKLQPWQIFIICCIFGWVNAATGYRRFTEADLLIPRKNGKSTLASGIGLYMLCADNEYGAEVYSGATKEKQAWEVFRPAWKIAKKTPELNEYFGVEIAAKSLYIQGDGSRFEPLVGDPGDGASPSCAIVDEYHEHITSILYDTMKTGMGARRQPLMLVITTAGTNIAGPCRELFLHLEKVLEGIVEDESRFGIVFSIDEGDDWRTEEALRKANPNYGISVYSEYLFKQQQEAIQQSSKQNIFKTKHLNVWGGAMAAYFNMEFWKKGFVAELSLDDFLGQKCWSAGDLSAKVDLTAWVLCFVRMIEGKRHYYLFGRYWLPQQRIDDADMQHYQRWNHQGFLAGIPGNEIDLSFVKVEMLKECKRFKMQCIAFDPWGALQLQQELAKELPTDTVITMPQQVRYLSDPMKELNAAILAGRVHHNGDPVLAWCVSNVQAYYDANENVFPRKERVENKIDAAVAAIMAVARAQTDSGRKTSVYETRGIRSL